MIGVAYSLIAVGFRAISMDFFEFLESKNILKIIFKSRGYFKQKSFKKMYIWPGFPSIMNLSFFKNTIKPEPLGVRG